MLTPLREALYFTRNQFRPLLIIALFYGVPAYLLEISGWIQPPAAGMGLNQLLLMLVAVCLNLLPFASAILYIDGVSHNRGTSIANALSQAISKLPWLILLNILLGAIVGVGFMLLIAPGIFFAYKLLFAEMYLLLHQEAPMQALKSSYKATTGLMAELLPPLVIWFGGTILLSLFLATLLGADGSDPVASLIQHAVMMLVTIYGWALIYRLYQRYLEAEVEDFDEEQDEIEDLNDKE